MAAGIGVAGFLRKYIPLSKSLQIFNAQKKTFHLSGIEKNLSLFLSEVASWMVTGERQAARIRGLYLKTILRQDVAFFDKETNTGEVVGRMSGDTVLIQDAMGEKVLYCCTNYTKIHNWPKVTLSFIHLVHLIVFRGIKEFVCFYRLGNFCSCYQHSLGAFL